MTTTAKVIIGILAAGAVGTGAYFAFRPKKKEEEGPGRPESELPPIPNEVIAEITKPSDMIPIDVAEPEESYKEQIVTVRPNTTTTTPTKTVKPITKESTLRGFYL